MHNGRSQVPEATVASEIRASRTHSHTQSPIGQIGEKFEIEKWKQIHAWHATHTHSHKYHSCQWSMHRSRGHNSNIYKLLVLLLLLGRKCVAVLCIFPIHKYRLRHSHTTRYTQYTHTHTFLYIFGWYYRNDSNLLYAPTIDSIIVHLYIYLQMDIDGIQYRIYTLVQ